MRAGWLGTIRSRRISGRGALRILLATGLLTKVAGCSGKPQDPSALPSFMGSYTLVVEASSVCRLSTSRFQWDVQVTATGTGQGEGVRATLPGGDDAVDVSLSYSSSRSAEPVMNGRLAARRVPFAEELEVTIGGNARGPVRIGSGGRGEVAEGVLNGTISLSRASERANDALGSCTAADHRWMLTPR